MIGWVISTLAGIVLRTSSNRILREIAGTVSKGDDNQARIAVAEIEAEIKAREAMKEVRLATAGFVEMRVLAFLITFPFVVHLWAVAMDTIFKLGWRVPAFPHPFDENGWKIMLSYFGLYGGAKLISAGVSVFRR